MYDLIIIGGSASGTTAGIYAARRGLTFKMLAKDLGGEVALSGEIENWPGVIHTTGIELAEKFREHLMSYRPDLLEGPGVRSIVREEDGSFTVATDDGQAFHAHSVILATGMHPRELGIPGEKEYRARGVSYCTVCDGPVFKGLVTATIGGGNSALESALMMADIASRVYVINKNPAFKGEKLLMDNLAKKTNVTIVYDALTTDIIGDGTAVNALKYRDKDRREHTLAVQGTFIHIGSLPNSGIAPAGVQKNDFGEIIVGLGGETSMPGFFAAGDVTSIPHKQIAIAAGQGSAAALSAVQYVNRVQK